MDLPKGCYAVIFTSRLKVDAVGYSEMSKRMLELSAKEPGFLGVESAREADGFGITISYWKTIEDIKRWKINSEHREAQRRGAAEWYSQYDLRICKFEG